jgi:hypothetical protein
VKIGKGLKDTHGQVLTGTSSVEFVVGAAERKIGSFSGVTGMVVIDPAVLPTYYPVMVYNLNELRLRVYQVTIEDWDRPVCGWLREGKRV